MPHANHAFILIQPDHVPSKVTAMRARTGSGDREHHATGNHGIKAAGRMVFNSTSHDIFDTLADMNALMIKRYFLNSVTIQPLLRDSKLPRGKRTQEAFHEAQHNVPVVFVDRILTPMTYPVLPIRPRDTLKRLMILMVF